MTQPFVELRSVGVELPGPGATPVRALDGVSLVVQRGETLGLVGESGSGKSTLGRVVLGLQRPSRGEVWVEGRDLATLSGPPLRALRRRMQPVFQDPSASLNPLRTVGEQVAEPLRIHGLASADRSARVAELLEQVGLSPGLLARLPRELSGGQRQRVAIARALAVEPELIVADEPLSALDASIQAQILNLFLELKRRRGLTYLFISHDLDVVAHLADRVAVLYRGALVELGPTQSVLESPKDPYTQSLVACRRWAPGAPGAAP